MNLLNLLNLFEPLNLLNQSTYLKLADGVLAVVPPGPDARTTALSEVPAGSGLTSVEMSTEMSPPTGVGLPRSRVATGLAVTGSSAPR